MRYLAFLVALLLSASVHAAPSQGLGGGEGDCPFIGTDAFPTCDANNEGICRKISNGTDAADCTGRALTNYNTCVCDGSTWVIQGDGSGSSPGADSIGTSEIDDGTDTPAAGEWVQVDSVDQAGFEYRTDAEALSDIGAAAASHTHGFDEVTAAENTAALTIGTGGSLAATGTGTIDATTGDSATAFFDAGAIEFARGGLNADISGLDDIILAISSGSTAGVNTKSGLETMIGGEDLCLADGDTYTGTHDMSGAVFLPPGSASLPGTCSAGSAYYNSSGTSGQRFYICESTNNWVLQGDGGGGGSGDVESVGDCGSGACYDGTSDGGTYLILYDAAGTMTMDWDGSCLDFDQPICATSFTSDPFTTPYSNWDDSDDTGTIDCRIEVNCPTTNDCDMELKCDTGTDTEYTFMKWDVPNDLVGLAEPNATLQLGNPGTNYAVIEKDGDISFAGTAQPILPASTSVTPAAEAGKIVVDTNGDNTNITHGVARYHDGVDIFNIIGVREYPSVNGYVLKYNSTNNDIEWALDSTGGTPTFDSIANGTNTTANAMVVGNGASLSATGTGVIDATTGDSATGFFDAGTIEHERGGLEADLSTCDGMFERDSGGDTQCVTNLAGLNTALGSTIADGAHAAGANPTANIGATAVNGSSSDFMRADGAPALPGKFRTHMCDFNVEAPVTGDDGDFQCHFPNAATIVEVYCSTDTATSEINLYERAEATPNTGTTKMLTADLVCDSDGQSTTSFSDSAIAADSVLALALVDVFTTGIVRVHVETTID